MSKDVQPLKVDKLVGGEVGLEEISEVDHPLHIACRGLYNPAAHRRLLNVCRDCYNLFREAEVCLHVLCQIFHIFLHSHFLIFTLSYFHFFHTKVFSMCTANCFDSPFFLTCAKALLMELDTVVKDTMTVG